MMIDEQHIDLITTYLDGSITSDERARLNALIDAGEIDILNVKKLESIYNKMGKLPSAQPSNRMRDSFYALLEAEKQEQVSPGKGHFIAWIQEAFTLRRIQQFGLAAALFILGMFAGNLLTPFQDYRQQMNQLMDEVSQMREVMMMSLLDAQSSSDRLKAVNISSEIPSGDDRIITALLKTLNNDPNVNVRLASIEALLRHADNPVARQGLVEAISKQQSPQVQVALADAMLALQEPESVDELRQLLRQQELDATVRNKLQNTITALI